LVSLRIPTPYRTGLVLIARMPDAEIESLIDALSGDQIAIRPFSKLAERVRPHVSIPAAQVDEVVEALTALYSVRVGNEEPVDVFIRDVSLAMRRGEREGEKIREEDAPKLEERLTRLMSIDTFNIASKASDLQFGYERVFEGARIFTDIRPVFGGESTGDVRGAVIINQLRISCVEGQGVKDFFFALDQDDVATLKRVLERAEAKTKTLAALLLQTGVTDLGSHTEETNDIRKTD
jgi:hypothetical protein